MLRIFQIIFWFFILCGVLFLLCVFLLPDFADQYGNPNINAKIRNAKELPMQIYSPDGSIVYPEL